MTDKNRHDVNYIDISNQISQTNDRLSRSHDDIERRDDRHIERLERQTQRNFDELKKSIDRYGHDNKWFMALMITIIIGFVTLILEQK